MGGGWQTLVPVALTLLTAFSFLLLGSKALLLLGAVSVIVFAVLTFRWPDLTTVVAVGLIYSNLPVVAVNFHGAPGILPPLVLGMLAWPFLYHIWFRGEGVRILPCTPWVLFLALVQGLGAWFSSNVPYSMEQFLAFLLEGAALYFIVINVIRTRTVLLQCFVSLAFCAALMGGFPMTQQLTGMTEFDFGGLAQVDSGFATEENIEQGKVLQRRSAGTIGEQNRFAQFMIMLAPIGFCLYASATTLLQRCAAGFSSLMALFGFALAFSRGAAVGLLMTIVAMAALGFLTKRQLKQLFLVGCLVLLVLPQYLVRLSSLAGISGILSQNPSGISNTDGAVRGRLTEMMGAAMAFRDRPLLGLGPGMFKHHSQLYGQLIGLRPLPAGRQAHSLPLDIAAEHGLLGLIAMTGLISVLFLRLLRARKLALQRQDDQGIQICTALTVMLMLYLSTSLFLHLSYIRYFWLMVGICEAATLIVTQSGIQYKANHEIRSGTG